MELLYEEDLLSIKHSPIIYVINNINSFTNVLASISDKNSYSKNFNQITFSQDLDDFDKLFSGNSLSENILISSFEDLAFLDNSDFYYYIALASKRYIEYFPMQEKYILNLLENIRNNLEIILN